MSQYAVFVEILAGSPPPFACFTRLVSQFGIPYFGYFMGQHITTEGIILDVDDFVYQMKATFQTRTDLYPPKRLPASFNATIWPLDVV